MLNKYPVLRVISTFILPYIAFFALYIQINGEVSPGGGFQAGTIFASCVILRSFFKPDTHLTQYYVMAVLGVIIYAGIGFITMFGGSTYLDYFALHADPYTAQKIGIIVIELGVGMTVFSSMSLIYFLFTEER